jgi:hypothetical protein
MPQLDALILSSQVVFVFLFLVGYFIFLKTSLPLISIEMKFRNKLLLNQMKWIKINFPRTYQFQLPYVRLMLRTRGLLNVITPIVISKKIFFGIYPMDLYYIKHRGQDKKNFF